MLDKHTDGMPFAANDKGLKLFFEPKVYLIAKPWLDREAISSFLMHEESGRDWTVTGGLRHEDFCHLDGWDGEHLVEFAGRMCYGSFGEKQGRKDTGEYLENIIKAGHGSVLEHACYTFAVARCTRGFTHQQVRHRAGFAYSQESTHFIQYGDSSRAALPGVVSHDMHLSEFDYQATEKAVEVAMESITQSLEAYAKVYHLIHGVKKEKAGQARSLLPNAIESKLCFTANLRALRHMIELRGAKDNTVEIRQVAVGVLKHMQHECGSVFHQYTIKDDDRGFQYVESEEGAPTKV